MKTEHTPGPWHADSVDRVRSKTGIVVARCERNERHEYMDSKEQSANARLIAAAPRLLEFVRLVAIDDAGPLGAAQLLRELGMLR